MTGVMRMLIAAGAVSSRLINQEDEMDDKKKTLLRMAGLGMFIDRVDHNQCPTCGRFVDLKDMRDELSRREFEISGMCQKCQDEVFGGEPCVEA